MALSLAEIIAAKTKKQEPEASPAFIVEDDDLFILSANYDTDLPSAASLQVFLSLVHVSAHKAGLNVNNFERMRKLAEWLGPFSSSHLPYKEPIPIFLQSHTLWQMAAIINIQPAKLWPLILDILVAEKRKI